MPEQATGRKIGGFNVTGVILMQVLPFADNKCLEAFAGFERGVYAGLDAAGQKAA